MKQNIGFLHFWIKCENGNEYDVGEMINYKVFKKNGWKLPDDLFQTINVLELPSNIERIDMETHTERETNENLNKHFHLYLQDPSEYWREAPSQMVDLRNDVLSIYLK